MAEMPLTIELTPNGKTLLIAHPGPVQGTLTARALQLLGPPEIIGPGEDDPENILILWPHQDMPEELSDLAERMTSANLLFALGFDRAGDDSELSPGASEGSPGPAPDPPQAESYEVAGNSLAPEIAEGDIVTIDRSRAAADGDVVFMPWRDRQCIVSRYRVAPDGRPYLADRHGNHRIPADASFHVVTERRRVLK